MELILKSLDLIYESGLWKDKPPSHILRILMYMNNKGWLYTPSVNGEVKAVIGAYRIKEGDNLDKLPLKEEGNILYVPFVISLNKEDNIFEVVRETTRKYLDDNPDIEEIVLHDKNEKFRRFKIKGEENGETETVRATTDTAVSN